MQGSTGGATGAASAQVKNPSEKKRLRKLLNDPVGCSVFKRYLSESGHLSSNPLDFWVSIEHFKQLTQPEVIKEVAREIHEKFLATDSPQVECFPLLQ